MFQHHVSTSHLGGVMFVHPTGNYKKDLPKGYTIIHSAMRSLARIGALGYRLSDGLRGNEEEIYSVKDLDLLVEIANANNGE